jgi:hypothetical protein
VSRTLAEDQERIVADLNVATEQLGLAASALGLAFDQLDEVTGDRLDGELFRPTQKAFGRTKRTMTQFAERMGLEPPNPSPGSPGLPSQGVKALVERAAASSAQAGHTLSELQDSMLPIEAGDAELRSAIAEVRELIDSIPSRTRAFLRGLGR